MLRISSAFSLLTKDLIKTVSMKQGVSEDIAMLPILISSCECQRL